MPKRRGKPRQAVEQLTPEKAFGLVMYERREVLGLTQYDLEDDEMDRSVISKLERGIRQPTLRTILHIAKLLQMPTAELIIAVEEKLAAEARASESKRKEIRKPRSA